MAKSSLSFVCQNCGAAYNRWQGKCESCGEWNTLVEEDTTGVTTMPVSIRSKRKGRVFALEALTGKSQDAPRLPSGMAELDRVTGGGFVRGSVLLVGGDPGIGKSTLLTQATSLLARAGHRAVYISGEEAVAQVRLRAERLGLADAPVQLAAETSVEDIVSTLSEGTVPRLIVIDSIQTMWSDSIESTPGTVSQVRGSAQALMLKRSQFASPRSMTRSNSTASDSNGSVHRSAARVTSIAAPICLRASPVLTISARCRYDRTSSSTRIMRRSCTRS